jgi:competence protein ComEC
MILSALSFLAGIVLVQQFSELPSSQWLLLIAACACIMAWLRYWRWLFFIMGVLWAIVFALSRLADRLPEALEGFDMPVTGIVVDLPQQDERRTRFDFRVTESAQQLPSNIRLSWYFPDQSVKSGQRWSFMVKLKRPHGNLNPGGFDYERWLFTQNVGATGYVRPNPKPVLLGRASAWSSISVWRQSITDRLSDLLINSPSLGLIKALTIGDGSSITQNQWDVFRKTGTTHLVVISGSHVGLIAGLAYFLVLRFWARTGWLKWSPQTVAAVVAMVVAVFYAGLAGFSVPTQRSVIMLVIAMLAVILQRNIRPFNTLAIALVAVLLFDPLSVLSVGFWLSFLAVLMIVYVIAGRLRSSGYLLDVIKINWATSVGLSPLLLLFFQQVSLISPLANFIAVPVISLLAVPLALVGVLVMFVSPFLAVKLFFIVDVALQGLGWLLFHMAEWTYATVTHVQPSVWALVFAIPGVLLLLAPRGIPARWLSLIMFLPLIFTASKKPEPGSINLTVLDVGQALSLVVQTQNHWLIYDAGAKFSEESDIGKSVLLPFLRQQGAEKVDKLIISHGDNDHIGGAVSVLRGIPVEQLLTSAPERLTDYLPVKCRAGQTWLWDDVRFISYTITFYTNKLMNS